MVWLHVLRENRPFRCIMKLIYKAFYRGKEQFIDSVSINALEYCRYRHITRSMPMSTQKLVVETLNHNSLVIIDPLDAELGKITIIQSWPLRGNNYVAKESST